MAINNPSNLLDLEKIRNTLAQKQKSRSSEIPAQSDINYDTLKKKLTPLVELMFGKPYLEDINDIKAKLENLARSFTEIKEGIETLSISTNEGSGNMSEEITNKIHAIDLKMVKSDTKLEGIENFLKEMNTKIDKLPTSDYVGRLIAETNTKIEGINTRISDSQNTMLKWIVGTGFVAVAAIFTIMKYFK